MKFVSNSQEETRSMLSNRDYRHNKDFISTQYSDGGVIPQRTGSKPTVTKSKLAGKCSVGYALFFVGDCTFAEHIVTPIDSADIKNHKLACTEGHDLTR